MNPDRRLAALEGLRGYAALLVFFVHAFGYLAVRLHGVDLERYTLWGDTNPGRIVLVLLARSHYGVDVFFVLSGIFMADLALRRWPGTVSFLSRRWLRIYPAYAVSAVAIAVVSVAGFGQAWSAVDILLNAAILQGIFALGIPAINPVSWSLSYEVGFYLAVPLLAAARARLENPDRRHALALLSSFAVIVAIAALLPMPKAIYFAYFALFIPGVWLGLLGDAERNRLAQRVPAWAAIGLWVAFAAGMKLEAFANSGPAYYLASGAACGLLVLKACDSQGRLASVLSAPIPRWLGKYSYSFFLIHYLVVHAWGAVTKPMAATWSAMAYSAVFVAGALAFSLVAAYVLFAATERFYFRTRAP